MIPKQLLNYSKSIPKQSQNDPKIIPMTPKHPLTRPPNYPNRSPHHPKLTPTCPPNLTFPSVLWKNNNPHEGGIEPGTAPFRPPLERGPNHWAHPALEDRLHRDFLCTENTGPGLAPRIKLSSVHKNTTSRLGVLGAENLCLVFLFENILFLHDLDKIHGSMGPWIHGSMDPGIQ